MGPKAGRKTPELEKPNPDLGRGGEARLRQGFFLNPLSPRALLCRIGPRRQGSAAPLRALDCSGPIRKTRCLRGKRGSAAPVLSEAHGRILPRGRFMKCPHCLVFFHDAWTSWLSFEEERMGFITEPSPTASGHSRPKAHCVQRVAN